MSRSLESFEVRTTTYINRSCSLTQNSSLPAVRNDLAFAGQAHPRPMRAIASNRACFVIWETCAPATHRALRAGRSYEGVVRHCARLALDIARGARPGIVSVLLRGPACFSGFTRCARPSGLRPRRLANCGPRCPIRSPGRPRADP